MTTATSVKLSDETAAKLERLAAEPGTPSPTTFVKQ